MYVTRDEVEEIVRASEERLKSELIGTRTELRSEMVTKAELRSEIADLKTELRSEMADMKTELRSEMADMKTELRSEMADMKTELRSEMRQMNGELRQEINGVYTSLKADMVRKEEVDKQRFDALMMVVTRNEKESRHSIVELFGRMEAVEKDVKTLKARKAR